MPPFIYNIRNILVRWRSTAATILGIALVVAVYVLVQSLAAGLEKSSENTGDPRNMLIIRKGSTAESSSQVTRDQLQTLFYIPEIARDADQKPIISADITVLLSLPRRNSQGEANVILRGVSPQGVVLRPQVHLIQGRWFVPGKREAVVSRRLAARFASFQIGDHFKTANKEITITGWTDGGNSAFDSELWMDADEARSLFDRENYSSILARLAPGVTATNFSDRIENDKKLPLRALPEMEYYASQTMTAVPIKILGGFLATAMSIGAVFAAMNTMYASIGSRTREIGTLRVLGYRRRTVMASFLLEGIFLSLIGGVLGCLMALPMHGYSTGTMSFESFAETVFQFRITPFLALKGLLFAAIVGFIGSFFPAWRASRLPVTEALKSV